MITEKMTLEEMHKEIKRDSTELYLKSFTEYRLKMLRRASVKHKDKMACIGFFVNTSSKNRYACTLSVSGWKNFRKESINYCFVAIYNTSRGRYAVTTARTKDVLFDRSATQRFQPHFFSRYAERTNKNLTGEDLILKYFMHNNLACMQIDPLNRDENEVFCSSVEGLSLGYREGFNVKFNTFIPYDNLNKTKYELSQEEVKHLHEMMIDKFGGIIECEKKPANKFS